MKRLSLIWILIFYSLAATGQVTPIVIRTSKLLDGRGNVLKNMDIVIEDGIIVRVEKSSKAVPTYDLAKFTVLPGWIDTHTHITWHFGPNGRFGEKEETPEQATLAAAGNAYATLMAGFTTIQCLGS